MAEKEKQYEPANYLLVDVVQAGSDLIENAGYAKHRHFVGEPINHHVLADMEKSAQKVLDSLKAYRSAIEKVGPKGTLPRAEYRATT